MNCNDVQQLLEPFSDGELDLSRQIEIENHLAGCDDCVEQQRNLVLLRKTISQAAPYYHASRSLKIQCTPVSEKSGKTQLRTRSPALVACLVAATILIALLTVWQFQPLRSQGDDRFADLVVANHVRSLQINHLLDVTSTDQHTVKPWFLGKVGFSPPVPELSKDGFPLAGGRLEYLLDRPMAAIVYFRKEHPINVYIAPSLKSDPTKPRGMFRNGYRTRSFQLEQMNYWVVSDLNDQDLDAFVVLFKSNTSIGSEMPSSH